MSGSLLFNIFGGIVLLAAIYVIVRSRKLK